MKQMTIDERNRIEFLVGCGRTVPQIANELGRNPSTIRNELIKHRIVRCPCGAMTPRVAANRTEAVAIAFRKHLL